MFQFPFQLNICETFDDTAVVFLVLVDDSVLYLRYG